MHLVKFSYNIIIKLQLNLVLLKYCMVENVIPPLHGVIWLAKLMLGPDLLKEMELTMKQVQSTLKIVQDK